MGCNCGSKGGRVTEYRVMPKDGPTRTVTTMTEVRRILAAEGGGTYQAVGAKTV